MTVFRYLSAALIPLLVIAAAWGLALPEINGSTKAAARAGDPVAQYEVARMYFEGIGVEQDTAEALKWATKAAEQGEPYAQFTLGLMYMRGQDVPMDDARGFELVKPLPSRIIRRRKASWPSSTAKASACRRTGTSSSIG